MIRATTGLAVTAALLLAACGQSGGGGGKITGMVNSCAMLKAIDAPGLIGVEFEAPKSLRDVDGGENAGKMSSCGLSSVVPEETPDTSAELGAQFRKTWFVTLIVWTWPNAQSAEAYMDSMRQSEANQVAPVPVSGLGDDAIWTGTIQARKDNVTISMDVRGPTEPQGDKSEKALETELAKRALDNLK